MKRPKYNMHVVLADEMRLQGMTIAAAVFDLRRRGAAHNDRTPSWLWISEANLAGYLQGRWGLGCSAWFTLWNCTLGMTWAQAGERRAPA